MSKKKIFFSITVIFTLIATILVVGQAGSDVCPKCYSPTEIVSIIEDAKHPCGCIKGDIVSVKCTGYEITGCKWEDEVLFDSKDEHKSYTTTYEPCLLCGYSKGIKVITYPCGLNKSNPVYHDCNSSKLVQ